jgi:uncharacterized UPF0160 family protein
MSKIITHAGQFHADELLAIALLHEVIGELEVIRTFSPQPEEGDWVLDIGGVYDPESRGFDHHQDPASPATNVLVLKHLGGLGFIEPEVGEILLDRLFDRVSDVDRGLARPEPWEFNALIAAYNGIEGGFEQALAFARATVRNLIRNAKQAIEDQDRYFRCPVVGPARLCEDSRPILGWKEIALELLDEEMVCFLVTPNARGGWQAISADSERWNIPADPRQTFRHTSGFMAVYGTKEECLAHLQEVEWDLPSWSTCTACAGTGVVLMGPVEGETCGYCSGMGTVGHN